MFNYFHLFSFLPVLAFGGVFWYERMHRQGAHKRTTYLFLSLVSLALVGLLQTLAWTFRSVMPVTWPQVLVLSGILYFIALMFLEYAIHVKRIEESFLLNDYRKEIKRLAIWAGAVGVIALLVVAGAPSWQWDHTAFPLSLMLDTDAQTNPLVGYTNHMKLLTVLFSLILFVVCFLAARRVFNLQEGVIRKREYPFYAQILVTFIYMIVVIATPAPAKASDAVFLPLGWFTLLNLVYIVRLVEEFFFWSQYNLRSDRNKMEQRQHTQNLLIRRVIGAEDVEDRAIVRELMDSALEKAQSRMVVSEYKMTGMAVYRATGNILKVEDLNHIIGYCTPLADHKSIKNLDKQKLNDQILRTTFDIAELRNTMLDNLKDFGKKMVKEAMTEKRTVVVHDLPEGLKGLQRLAVVVPIFDSNNFMGFLTVFKDSFDRLYPGEKEVLEELAENLATVYALMAGKEVQRERNRLQGEMNTARTIQTSILPKKVQMPGFQVGTYMETATEVGGDVFDFIASPFGTYFGIGDVAGHGLPAGMMAVISVAALHGAIDASKVLGKPLPLDQVYDTVNRVLCTLNRDRIGSDKFMTQNYFVANGGKIDHVGTHLPAALWRAKTQTVEELHGLTDKTGFLGLSEYVVSNQSLGSFTMEAGDVLVLYSDGVSESMNGNGTMFALEGIKRALVEHAEKTPDEFITALMEDLKHHAAAGDFKKHGGHFTDDVSLVVLKKE
jgi:sigma-B regulation protein RsbU (phosphoserine phosphatase)